MQILCPAALPRSYTGSWPTPPTTSKSQSSDLARASLRRAHPFHRRTLCSRIMATPVSTRPPSFITTVLSVYRTSGARGFYAGLGTSLLRAFPSNACALFVYEGLMRTLDAEKVSTLATRGRSSTVVALSTKALNDASFNSCRLDSDAGCRSYLYLRGCAPMAWRS